MKIAIDISPLSDTRVLSHRVRGTGFYLTHLQEGLKKYFPQNEYIFFTRDQKIEKDIDVVHYPYFEPFFLTTPLRKPQKTIVTVHDLTPFVFPQYFPSGMKGKIRWQINKFLLQKTDAVITDSLSSKKDIIRFAGVKKDKIHVVYLAAGEEFKKVHVSKTDIQSLRETYNLPDRFVLYVGDATWNKNLPRLLEAVKRAQVPLVMIGKTLTTKNIDRENPWNQDLLRVQEMIEMSTTVQALGFVPTEDLIALYNLATVFVMPSLYEGFGLPILEAMSCGCPVVTTKEGSLAEVAGDAAMYVDAYSEEAIAEGIKKVWDDTALQEELQRKGLIQSEKFHWEMTAKQTVEVYKKVYEQ